MLRRKRNQKKRCKQTMHKTSKNAKKASFAKMTVLQKT